MRSILFGEVFLVETVRGVGVGQSVVAQLRTQIGDEVRVRSGRLAVILFHRGDRIESDAFAAGGIRKIRRGGAAARSNRVFSRSEQNIFSLTVRLGDVDM